MSKIKDLFSFGGEIDSRLQPPRQQHRGTVEVSAAAKWALRSDTA